jgi:hypothetical protein
MIQRNTYNDSVIAGILADDEFGITQVDNLKSLKIILLDQSQYPTIKQFIKNHHWQSIASLNSPEADGFKEYLDIVKFTDQRCRRFVATIYDSDELSQDPQIIDIFLIED